MKTRLVRNDEKPFTKNGRVFCISNFVCGVFGLFDTDLSNILLVSTKIRSENLFTNHNTLLYVYSYSAKTYSRNSSNDQEQPNRVHTIFPISYTHEVFEEHDQPPSYEEAVLADTMKLHLSIPS